MNRTNLLNEQFSKLAKLSSKNNENDHDFFLNILNVLLLFEAELPPTEDDPLIVELLALFPPDVVP